MLQSVYARSKALADRVEEAALAAKQNTVELADTIASVVPGRRVSLPPEQIRFIWVRPPNQSEPKTLTARRRLVVAVVGRAAQECRPRGTQTALQDVMRRWCSVQRGRERYEEREPTTIIILN